MNVRISLCYRNIRSSNFEIYMYLLNSIHGSSSSIYIFRWFDSFHCHVQCWWIRKTRRWGPPMIHLGDAGVWWLPASVWFYGVKQLKTNLAVGIRRSIRAHNLNKNPDVLCRSLKSFVSTILVTRLPTSTVHSTIHSPTHILNFPHINKLTGNSIYRYYTGAI